MDAKLTQDELQAIKERAEKATEGPWSIEPSIWDGDYVINDARGFRLSTLQQRPRIDAEFIAHARQDIPKLVAEVERLTNVIWRMSSYCDLSTEETRRFINGGDDD